MLELITALRPEDLCQNPFLLDGDEIVKVICPSPLIADQKRSEFNRLGLSERVNVSTMARFVSEEIAQRFEEDSFKFYRKSDLLLELSVVWKNKFSHLSDEVFFQAFTIFTELRSSSMDLDLMSEALQHYGETVALPVVLFWHYLEHMDILDEHGAFHMLSEKLRENVEVPDEGGKILFSGFSHMSGVQVDFLKSLSIRKSIGVQFSPYLIDKVGKNDWIDWVVDLAGEEVAIEQFEKKKIKYITFPKNRLAETLKDFAQNQEQEDGFRIILGEKNLDAKNLFEIPLSELSFKCQVDIFGEKLNRVISDIDNLFLAKGSENIKSDSILEYVSVQYEVFKTQSIENKDFRLLKIVKELEHYYEKWSELSDANADFRPFDLKVLSEYMGLNLPRVSVSPLAKEASNNDLLGINQIALVDNEKTNLLCVSGSFSPIAGNDKSFSEETMEVLSAIGPLRSAELDFQQTKEKIRMALSEKEIILLMEEGTLDHDRSWLEIVDGFELEKIDLGDREKTEKPKAFSKYPFKAADGNRKLSPTYLQSFIDCPRKFYFSYVEPMSLFSSPDYALEPRHLGEIEHKVIELFFKENIDIDDVRSLSSRTMDWFLKKNRISLMPSEFRKYLMEVSTYSYLGIQFVRSFKKLYPHADFKFEQRINKPSHGGSVDLLIDGEDVCGIIDFKRSKSSIPAVDHVIKMEKVQLPYYLKHSEFMEKENVIIGHINLSNPAESKVFSNNSDLVESLGHFLPDYKIKIEPIPFNIDEILSLYEEKEKNVVESIMNEKEFKAMPTSESVCMFCELQNVCDKGN